MNDPGMGRLRLYLDLCTSSYLALDDGEGRVMASQVHSPPLRNEAALNHVEALLRETGQDWRDIGSIAVAAGPGSFTGIRVGVALAQGLAFARQLPLHPFSTLGALQARQSDAASLPALSAIAAHGGRWYMRPPGGFADSLVTTAELESLGHASLWVTGELPKDWDAARRFSAVHRLELDPDWPRLFAYAFSQPVAPQGMVHPAYVQASAAETKRLSEAPIFRDWVESDMPRLAALERECNPQAWSQASLAKHGRDGGLGGVVETGGEIVGYWVAQDLGEEAEILLTGITARHRRRGLAFAMLDSLLSALARKGLRRCHLEVRAGNTGAQRLYRKLGFAEAGRRKVYYADNGEDALIMTLSLTPSLQTGSC